MQGKGLWIGLGIVVAVLLVTGYFLFMGSAKKASLPVTSNVTPIVTPTPIPSEALGEDDEATREITIEAEEFSFSNEKISVKKGEKIKLTLVNNGRMSHDFVVEDTDITTALAGPGKSVTIEFTVDDPGTYTFYCSIGNHRAMGMEGTLEVTE